MTNDDTTEAIDDDQANILFNMTTIRDDPHDHCEKIRDILKYFYDYAGLMMLD